jgi:flagellar basal body-associated protein FliL
MDRQSTYLTKLAKEIAKKDKTQNKTLIIIIIIIIINVSAAAVMILRILRDLLPTPT